MYYLYSFNSNVFLDDYNLKLTRNTEFFHINYNLFSNIYITQFLLNLLS